MPLAQCFTRIAREEEQKDKSRRRYVTPIKDKESYKWIAALKETVDNVPKDTMIITIGDREADIFKFLWKIEASGTGFVIRNRQDRKFICFETGKTKIQTKIRELEAKKVFKFEIPGNGNQKAREANIEVKYTYGLIPIRSASLYGSKDY